jgi:hypothetical protein
MCCVLVDKDTANAAVFDTFKQAAAAAHALVSAPRLTSRPCIVPFVRRHEAAHRGGQRKAGSTGRGELGELGKVAVLADDPALVNRLSEDLLPKRVRR